MNWNAFRDWAFTGLVAAGVLVLWTSLGKLENSVEGLSKSMQQATSSLAVMSERSVNHEKRLDKHDLDIEHLKRERKPY